MKIYNYEKAVRNDIVNYINRNMDFADYTTIDELEDALYNSDLENENSITGSLSGSYMYSEYLADVHSIPEEHMHDIDTFSKYKAGENLIGNFDLLADALHHFGCEFSGDEEESDSLVRRYLIDDCIHDAVAEIKNEYDVFWWEDINNETEAI